MTKFEKDFKEWYRNYIKGFQNRSSFISGTYYEFFKLLPFSMQWGVYLAFFDSVGIRVGITPPYGFMKQFMYEVAHSNIYKNGGFDTREEAQEEAVEKAIEIYNGL